MLESRATVSLGSPVDPDNPLTTETVISNEGVLTLKDVAVESYMPFATYVNGPRYREISLRNWELSTLEPGQRETVALSRIIQGQPGELQDADLGLILCYRPWIVPSFLWFGSPKVFRFRAQHIKDGSVRFQQQPAGDIFEKYTAHAERQGFAPCQKEGRPVPRS